MSGNKSLTFIAIIAALALVGANLCLFVVKETESAIPIVLGNPGIVIEEAGLNVKLPWANIVKIDKRNLEYDLDKELEVSDINQEKLTVDAFARYRIVDPLIFYQSFIKEETKGWRDLRGNGENTIQRIMQNSLRQKMGVVTLEDIITKKREELIAAILESMRPEAKKFGVEIIDVKIRRADYPDDIADRVYAQMTSARQEEAELIRAEGSRESKRIKAEAERKRATILAGARKTSLQIRGEADALRTCILAGAYDGIRVDTTQKDLTEVSLDAEEKMAAMPLDVFFASFDPGDAMTVTCRFRDGTNAVRDPARAEFFAFNRSLEAYIKTFEGGQSTILMSPDNEFLRYFRDLQGK